MASQRTIISMYLTIPLQSNVFNTTQTWVYECFLNTPYVLVPMSTSCAQNKKKKGEDGELRLF